MRFLLDANISPLIATRLNEAGHSAVHVRDTGLREASDERIMDVAIQDERVIVSQDTDFTNLRYYRKASGPSLILLRNLPEDGSSDRRAHHGESSADGGCAGEGRGGLHRGRSAPRSSLAAPVMSAHGG